MTESKGITPDIVVTPTDQQKQLGQDPQLDRAIQFLTNPG
jgi:C-terminal processing protease CtpA/Prc